MKQKNLDTKQIIISGFALFAIFFGAGNLIFPPFLGINSGKDWFLASLGFNLSDSILILLGILALSFRSANLNDFGSKISKNFGNILSLICITLVGPLLSIPRTGATTFEVVLSPFYPNINKILFSFIFFALVYILTINGSKVIDRVGKYLTPTLLVILAILIVRGIMYPNIVLNSTAGNKFSAGFIEGYQTMDSLGPIFLTGMILEDFRNKGISEKNDLIRATIYSGLIAVFGLVVVYTGLTYVGTKSIAFADPDLNRTSLLITISENLLGRNVQIILSLVVGFACLSTAIGLVSAFASIFANNFKKLSYKFFVRIGVIISFVLSILGVDKIMEISIPILLFIYPIVISLYILNLIDRGNISPLAYKISIGAVALVSFADALSALGFNNNFYVNGINKLPLGSSGFAFVFVFGISLIIVLLISKKQKIIE
ncbi:branched-chain amino acid transport system II carrier protein [Anaerococcus sp. mt242]|uniref:branched-chain amino acid transport system II carrier protein n=1 Tax=Anaerococcus sp. mt242 TaxID=2661917 RepID=UPI0019314A6E|nr:branched-chain amino acid transport system II carrier protein [Anaerococcus sp. mt242]MBM0046777.1 branched-chain amino acid transport system II carrier protein [Anaerococcus sp. mt242]